MALQIGIVGLPNVGKSTTFNALTRAQNAAAENYPFCTIEANRAVVPVPDARLEKLAAIAQPAKVVEATVEFVDIAGLVEGASRGEGRGNAFLGNIRDTAAILHLVRCFEDENVVHVSGEVDPLRDIEIINNELILADLQSLEKRIVRLEKQARGDKKMQGLLDLALKLQEHFESGEPAVTFPERESETWKSFNKEMRFLSGKTVIFAANVDEDTLGEDNPYVARVRAYAEKHNARVIKVSARLEEEMAGMEDAERQEFLESMGATEGSGLEQLIRTGYDALGLQSFFTAGPKEVRAWTVKKGATAPEAAAVIHEDFQKGFIRAEVISYEDYIRHQGEAGARSAGDLRTEGKEYIVRDGDVMHFLFNV